MAGDDVDAFLGRRVDVVRPGWIGMDQRAVGTPVLGGGVGGKDFGHAPQLALASQQTICLAGERVGAVV